MIILGIDPGPRESGYVLWDVDLQAPIDSSHVGNEMMLAIIKEIQADYVAIERIRGYGIVAGDDTFDTCEYIGRFDMAAMGTGKKTILCPRKDIKRHLCGNTTTNDKYVREALIDRLEMPDFIGRTAKGQKTIKKGGRLYGISGHSWSALSVAIFCADQLADNIPKDRINYATIATKHRTGNMEDL